MELLELGTLLRKEREKRGLSLENIAQRTRISLTSLEGIESGRSDLLPHPVYVRGFIKVYAKFLDMDLGDALSELKFDKEDAPYKPVYKSASPELVKDEPEVRSLRTGNRLGLAVIMLLIAVAGATYWFFATTNEPAEPVERTAQAPVEEAAPPAQAKEQAEAQAESEFAPEIPPASEAEQAANVPADTAQPAPAAAPASTVPTQAMTPGPVQQTQAEQAPAAQAQPAVTNTAVIQAREVCWLKATHEDGTVREYMLQPGGRVRLNFSKVSLMLGNAGGVDITVNGQPYALNAQPGQVRRLTLP